MKTNKQTNKPKSNILPLLVLLFIGCIQSCSTEESLPENDSPIKTVTKEEALLFLKQNPINTSTKFLKKESFTLNFNAITQEKITNSDQLITIIPIDNKEKKEYERILFLKIKDTIKSAVFSMYPDENSSSKNFSGKIKITSLNGQFINGFRIKNGHFISRFLKKEPTNYKNKEFSKLIVIDGVEFEELDEVIIINNYHSTPSTIYYMTLFEEWSNYGGNNNDYGMGWNYGGGSGSGENDEIDEEALEDPCQKIKEQLQNTVISKKIEALKGKLTQKNETGFAQKKDGTFVDLKSTTDPNQQNLPPGSDFIGSMHTHQDPYPSEKFREDGTPIMIRPIPIFSPKDVVQFLEFLKNTKKNNAPIEDVYSIMVSNSAVYQLRFTGNIDDVRTNFDISTLNKEFIKSKKDNNGDEKLGFLNFLALSIGIDGLKLFEINTDGTINNMSYDNQKNLIKTPCN